MSNTVPSIGKHLSVCENFKTTYPDKIEYVKENMEARKQRTAELRAANNLKRQLDQSHQCNFYFTFYDFLFLFIFILLILVVIMKMMKKQMNLLNFGLRD